MTVTRIPSPSPYAPVVGFSAGVRAGDLVLVAGVSATGPDGEVVGDDNAYAQTRETLRKIEEILSAAGARLDQVVQTRMYIARREDWEQVGKAHGEVFGEILPASAMLVTALVDPRMLVEIEAVAHVGD